jgi:hypothetical protein
MLRKGTQFLLLRDEYQNSHSKREYNPSECLLELFYNCVLYESLSEIRKTRK